MFIGSFHSPSMYLLIRVSFANNPQIPTLLPQQQGQRQDTVLAGRLRTEVASSGLLAQQQAGRPRRRPSMTWTEKHCGMRSCLLRLLLGALPVVPAAHPLLARLSSRAAGRVVAELLLHALQQGLSST